MSLLLIVWHTIVDIACFVATAASMLRDPPALFKGADGVEFRPKRFVNRTLSLDDVKYVKNTMNCVRGSSSPAYIVDYSFSLKDELCDRLTRWIAILLCRP